MDRPADDEQVEVLSFRAALEDESGASGGDRGRRSQRAPDENPSVHGVHFFVIINKTGPRVHSAACPGPAVEAAVAFSGGF
jgi:hypothetical protein